MTWSCTIYQTTTICLLNKPMKTYCIGNNLIFSLKWIPVSADDDWKSSSIYLLQYSKTDNLIGTTGTENSALDHIYYEDCYTGKVNYRI